MVNIMQFRIEVTKFELLVLELCKSISDFIAQWSHIQYKDSLKTKVIVYLFNNVVRVRSKNAINKVKHIESIVESMGELGPMENHFSVFNYHKISYMHDMTVALHRFVDDSNGGDYITEDNMSSLDDLPFHVYRLKTKLGEKVRLDVGMQ